MKKVINVFEYAKEITESIGHGVLLTTKNGDKVNVMTVGWGMLGIEWEVPIFTAFVRAGRFTREQIDASGEFTVNIPYGDADTKVVGYCGSRTGRNINKANDMNLTLIESDDVKPPAIKEFPLTLECKVLYRQLQDRNLIPEDIRNLCIRKILTVQIRWPITIIMLHIMVKS